MLDKNPAQRLDAAAVLAHEWVVAATTPGAPGSAAYRRTLTDDVRTGLREMQGARNWHRAQLKARSVKELGTADADAIAISWERGGKVHATSKMTATSKAEGNECMAMVDDKLRMEATLYRSSKRAAFDSKQSLIRILDVSTASPAVLATAEFELADQVDLEPRSAPRSKQLRMPRVVRRGDRAAEITVQLSLSSVRHAAGAGVDAATDARPDQRTPSREKASMMQPCGGRESGKSASSESGASGLRCAAKK